MAEIELQFAFVGTPKTAAEICEYLIDNLEIMERDVEFSAENGTVLCKNGYSDCVDADIDFVMELASIAEWEGSFDMEFQFHDDYPNLPCDYKIKYSSRELSIFKSPYYSVISTDITWEEFQSIMEEELGWEEANANLFETIKKSKEKNVYYYSMIGDSEQGSVFDDCPEVSDMQIFVKIN